MQTKISVSPFAKWLKPKFMIIFVHFLKIIFHIGSFISLDVSVLRGRQQFSRILHQTRSAVKCKVTYRHFWTGPVRSAPFPRPPPTFLPDTSALCSAFNAAITQARLTHSPAVVCFGKWPRVRWVQRFLRLWLRVRRETCARGLRLAISVSRVFSRPTVKINGRNALI